MIQTEYRLPKLTVIAALFSGLCNLQYSNAQTAGSLDPSFSGDGFLVHYSPGIDVGEALFVQDDGRILATGRRIINGEVYLLVTRYLENGMFDQSFGVSGNYVHPLTSMGKDVIARPNGEIVIAGTTGNDILLVGLEADGSPNMDFQGGWISVDFGQTIDKATSIETDLDQRIYAAGEASGDFAITRFLMDGSPDTAFGDGGGVTTDFSGTADGIEDIAILSNGSILAVGYTTLGGYKAIAVTKYNYTGDLDTQFGVNGKVTLQFNTPFTSYKAYGIELTENGKFIVAGGIGHTTNNTFLAGFNANGSLDTTYGIDGIAGFSPGLGNKQYFSCRKQVDGKMVAVGEDQGDIHVARHLSNGALDPSFGNQGSMVLDIENGNDVASDVKIDLEGRIVLVANVTTSGASVPNRLLLARYVSINVGLLELEPMANNILVYPNPIDATTNIHYSLADREVLTIQLCDVHGRLIATIQQGIDSAAGEHIQIMTLPPDLARGNYLLVFSSPNGKMSIQVNKQ